MRRIGISAASVAALFLSSCSLLLQQQQQQPAPDPQPVQGEEGGDEQTSPAQKKAAGNEGDGLKEAVPSSEQQEAARHMLENQDKDTVPTVSPAANTSIEEIPEPIADSGYSPAVPGGRGLRMGNLAPPEEAASSSENAAPKPNSVEMRGLRSPSLPKGLPMDINGKLTPTN